MRKSYLSLAGAWALAFGCSVGWGAFVMPGTTFLPVAGPLGTAVGLGLGALVMMILGANYHYLMNRYPDGGGVYTYTKKCFGYDHGFLSAWFLILTYIAIIWANASALPLIARTLLGSTFQFGFTYEIAGFRVWFGEILLAVASLALGALVCLNRRLAAQTQLWFAAGLLLAVIVGFIGAGAGRLGPENFRPAFSPDHSPLAGVFTIFALTPWAYVGFESVSHSAAETAFSGKKYFLVFALALIAAALAYILLALLAVAARPAGEASWAEYVANLGRYEGIEAQPVFFAAWQSLGSVGSAILGYAALCGILTGLIGHYVALSRLLRVLSEDELLPAWVGRENADGAPRNAILLILGVSVFFPFLGRTAISWIVDVTTVGATIAYAFASAAAWKLAREERCGKVMATGLAGIVFSLLYALEFLIPNMTSVKTLSTESYLILAAWSILGFAVFRLMLSHDREHRYGRSIVAWVVLLGLIIFTSSVWMRQRLSASVEEAVTPIQTYYSEQLAKAGVDTATGATRPTFAYLQDVLGRIDDSVLVSLLIQIALVVGALLILFSINALIQKRERQTEVEKALAEENSQAKTSFLSNMSHEIRTPMNAIIGLDNIALREPNLPPKTREHLEKIGTSARHLLGLINDILDMSRIESGRMYLKEETFSFREFMDQINVMINGQCSDKGLRYECQIVGRPDEFFVGDDLKLKQVLINILGNAVKFTEAPGEVSFLVEQLGGEGEKRTMRFVVSDTGAGMDQDYIPKIFEPFSQEDATTTNRYGGSGLGMAITKSYVELMGGTIEVTSRKGIGSVFTVTVTLGASDRIAPQEQEITLPKGLRALVVDDDDVAREHTKMVLESIGVQADSEGSAPRAAERLREAWDGRQPYALLFTDFKMPDLNGLELTRGLRAWDGGRTIILLLTGYNWEIIDQEAAEAGVDGILAKPLYPETLIKKIHAALEKREGHERRMPAAEPERPAAKLAGRRILMAEDVEQNAEILQDLLELEEIEADRAKNGSEAVLMFSAQPAGTWDAILMDVRMPVMDGLEATRTIRALDRPDAKTIPIIAMTANVFDEDVQRSLEAGMNAHLSKPIDPDLMYETMARLIFQEGD